jgi:CRP-like cAMP-binding protein
MRQLTYSKGDIIFREGDNATVMYDVISGKVGIYRGYQTDQEEKVAELEAGQIFGEMGMIEIYPRSATAVALEDGVVLAEIGEADLEAYFKGKPDQLLQLMRQLSMRIRETTKKYVDVCGTVSRNRQAEEQKEEQPSLLREMDCYAEFYHTYWVY